MRSSRHTVSAVAGVVAAVIVAWTGGSAASASGGAAVPLPNVAVPVAPTAAAPNGSHEQLLNAYANLPVAFVENRGQIDARVRFYAQGPRYGFYLTRDELVLSFMNAEPAKSAVAISLQFLGGNPRAVLGDERAPGEVNYFRGNDPSRWHRTLPRYGQIVYRELWPGVDLSLREQGGTLKYRVPGAARRADRGHRPGLPRVKRPCAG